MEDTRITFETAKLAKEKKFPQEPNRRKVPYYNYKGEFNGDVTDFLRKYLREEDTSGVESVSAPTQSLLAKWLREKHEIYVTPRESYAFDQTLEFVCSVNNIFVNHGNNDEPINRFKTYEDAYEKGLQEALKLIKND